MNNAARIFSKALGIESPWFVKKVEFDGSKKRLEISIDFARGSTFSVEDDGHTDNYKAYDTIEKQWRHLNFFEHECYLKARVPRVKTKKGKIRLISPPWSGVLNGFTLLFEALILQICKDMPVDKVSHLVNMSNYKIWKILDTYVEEAKDSDNYNDVTAVGMDETSISKGHKYISLFVDMNKKRTISVAEGKGNETVKSFKKDLEQHQGNAKNITDVSCDMSRAFIKGVEDNLPKAQITFDRFHVLKVINNAVDEVRRDESKQNPLLKGKRFIFLKNEVNLTEEQRKQKEELKLSKLNIKALRALNIRESFQQIYQATTEKDFVLLLKKWYFWATHSRLEPIKKAAKTVKNHWDGIVNWKKSQINNGILEGLNSVVQAAKRKARGYKFKHFKTVVYLITGNLDFSKINPACLPT